MSRNKFTVCYDVRINSALNETYATIIEKIRYITQESSKGKWYDGQRWVFGSYEQLWENLFLNIGTPNILRRHINALEKMGVLISVRCQYEKLYRINQEVYDRFAQEGENKLSSRLTKLAEKECSDCAEPSSLNGSRLTDPEQSAHIYRDKKKEKRYTPVGGSIKTPKPQHIPSPPQETFDNFLKRLIEICGKNPKYSWIRNKARRYAIEMWRDGKRSINLEYVALYVKNGMYHFSDVNYGQVAEIVDRAELYANGQLSSIHSSGKITKKSAAAGNSQFGELKGVYDHLYAPVAEVAS